MARFGVAKKANKNVPVFSHEFFIQNHADIMSCVLLVFVVGMNFKATSNLCSMFVTFQHNVTTFNDEGRPVVWEYLCGVKDMATVFFYTLAAIVVHAIIQEYVVDKLYRKVHLSKTKTVKFNESGQLAIFSLSFVLHAGYIINTNGYLSQISLLWTGYPQTHRLLPLETKFFFIIQIAYWLHTFPELYLQKSKKDEIRTKSIISIIYLIFIVAAYVQNFTRVAVFILLLHYVSECVFHFCRLAYFLDKKHIALPGFRFWNILFVVIRLGCVCLAVLTFWYGMRSHEAPSVDLVAGNFNTKFIRLNCLLALCGLQAWMMWNFINFHLRRSREQFGVSKSRSQLFKMPNKKKANKGVDKTLTEADQQSAGRVLRSHKVK